MLKRELRKLYLHKRSCLTLQEAEEKSIQIKTIFFDRFNLSAINSVHSFLPILNKSEINTWNIIKNFWSNFSQIKVLVPKLNPINDTIESCILNPESAIEENAWGIPEPVASDLYPHNHIGMVLLPLLAFDKKGNRVGYGKGYYDEFLMQCSKEVIKVGLSFFEAEEIIDDVSSSDVPLDFCVTPWNVYVFAKAQLE